MFVVLAVSVVVAGGMSSSRCHRADVVRPHLRSVDRVGGQPADEPSRRFQPKRGVSGGAGARSGPASPRAWDGAGPKPEISAACSADSEGGVSSGEGGATPPRTAARSIRDVGLKERNLLDRLNFSALERDSVRPAAQKHYLRSLVALAAWMGSPLLPTLAADEWEEILLEWLEEVFMSGQERRRSPPCSGRSPGWGGALSLVLPRVSRALRGWKCRSPGHSRPPIPWIVVCGLCRRLLAWKLWDMALGLVLMFTAYLRPSELLAMRTFQLVPPNPFGEGAFNSWSILIHPMALQTPGKTGELDDSVSLDDPSLVWIGPCLRALKTARAESLPLWNISTTCGSEAPWTRRRGPRRWAG